MKKILLSSLLAVMAVTSANAKIASTNYVDEVAQTKADAAQAAAVQTAKTYTDGLTGDVVNSEYIKGLTNKTLTGAVEDLDSRVEGLTGVGDQAAATKKELEDGLATKLGKEENAVSATKATQDGSGNVITETYATKAEVQALDSTEDGTGNVIVGVTQTDGKVTVTKGDIAYSDLTGIPTVDTVMSDASENAVQNKVIKSYVDGAIAGVATDAELAAVSEVANNAKTIADGAVTVNTQQETAISKNTTDIATNTAAIALNTALRVAIENNANKVEGAGAAGTYALTAVVDEQGVSQFKWELIDRALAN